MQLEKKRMWDGKNLYINEHRWENSTPMSCSSLLDKTGTLLFELDIVKYKHYIGIIKEGVYMYKGDKLKGWYMELYHNNNKSITPLYMNSDDYEKVGNIYIDKEIYKNLKTERWNKAIDIIG